MKVIRTWFGSFELDDQGDIAKKDLFSEEAILDQLVSGEAKQENVINDSFFDLAIKSGFVSSKKEYIEVLHDITIKLAEKKVKSSFTPDQVVIQAINTLDEVDEALNLLCEKLSQWSYLHSFDLIKNEDEKQIINIELCILNLEEERSLLEDFISEKMVEMAPNISNLAGPLLGARLISLACGMKNLSMMPSSTIQILGAKKAIFRHLEKGSPPPKHGIIFKHPLIYSAPWWQRGKISKALASKLTIASRIDFYSGNLNDKIVDDLNCAIEKIRVNYPNPPSH